MVAGDNRIPTSTYHVAGLTLESIAIQMKVTEEKMRKVEELCNKLSNIPLNVFGFDSTYRVWRVNPVKPI